MDYKDPLFKRLSLDQQLLMELNDSSDLIDVKALNGNDKLPPSEYEVTYYVRSISGIDENRNPIYSDEHKAKITLPSGYPMINSPSCYMLTDTWHPNIRSKGNLKGHICINAQVLGTWQTLDLLVEQIGEMLQYKNYHAEKTQPYPEDAEVATWVLEYAEPEGIISKSKATDNRPLRKPSEDWMQSRKKKSKINILNVKVKSAIKLNQPIQQTKSNTIRIVKK